jgi:hypothetical protein
LTSLFIELIDHGIRAGTPSMSVMAVFRRLIAGYSPRPDDGAGFHAAILPHRSCLASFADEKCWLHARISG